MKLFIKKTFLIFAATLMVFTLSINAFATNIHFNRGYTYSGNYYQYNVKLVNGLGSEKITVVNTSNSPVDVYIGGVYRGQLSKNGSELTVAYSSGGTKSVKIQSKRTGTCSFRIKTTGYKDAITRVR